MNPALQRCLVPFAPLFARRQSLVLALRLRKALGRRMQNPPASFYDKIFWMSTHTDTSLWTALADKIQVREYVAEHCGSEILPKLYATYDTAAGIDFEALPDSFAIKTNNGCATNYLVRSKSDTDLEAIRKGLNRWLTFPYGALTGQMHYARIVPMILAEELLVQEDESDAPLVDYKFYCFDGEVRYCYVVSDRHFDQRHTHSRMLYDMDWKPLPQVFVDGVSLSQSQRPASLPRMKAVAEQLSQGIPFVRVDLYEVNGLIKFSEMTFMPGMDTGFSEDFQRELGDLIQLPDVLPSTTEEVGG